MAVDEDVADRAALTFGDCFTYALAEQTGFPILCAGDDFATDMSVRPLDDTRLLGEARTLPHRPGRL